jgi:hypothetical protein
MGSRSDANRRRRLRRHREGLCRDCPAKRSPNASRCPECTEVARLRGTPSERACRRCGDMFTGTALYCSERCRWDTKAPAPTTDGDLESTVCDCGNAKASGAVCCEFPCAWLDGTEPDEAALISELRTLGEDATLAALVKELGVTERSVFRALAKAKASGRLRTVLPLGGDDLIATYVGNGRGKSSAFETRTGILPNGTVGTYFVARKASERPNLAGVEGARPVYILVNRRAA